MKSHLIIIAYFFSIHSLATAFLCFSSVENVLVNRYMNRIWLLHWNRHVFLNSYWHWLFHGHRYNFLHRIWYLLLDWNCDGFHDWHGNGLDDRHVDGIGLSNTYRHGMGHGDLHRLCHWNSFSFRKT